MKDRASKVVGEFQILSKDEKKVVLEKILDDSANQIDAMNMVAKKMKKEVSRQSDVSKN